MPDCIKCSKAVPTGAPFCPWCGTKQTAKPIKKRTHGNGMGTVYQVGSAWRAEWTTGNELIVIDGVSKVVRHRKRKGGFATKRAAAEYLAQVIHDMRNPEPHKKKQKTIAELFDEYADAGFPSVKKKGKIGPTKQAAYKIAYTKRIAPAIGHLPIDQVVITDLDALVDPLTYYQAKDCRDLLSVLFNRAIAEGYIAVNLTDFVTLPEQNSEEVTPWTTEEIEKLWTAWGKGNRIAATNLLMIYTGMMPGELFNLKKDMIHWDINQIIGAGIKTSERKEKPIVFPDFIAPVLRDLCDTSVSLYGFVVGMSRDNYYAAFTKMKTELGIRPEVRPYSGRHSTHVSLAIRNVAPALIVKIMRQRNYKTSIKHYNQIEQDQLVTALNTLKNEKGMEP